MSRPLKVEPGACLILLYLNSKGKLIGGMESTQTSPPSMLDKKPNRIKVKSPANQG